MSWSESVSQSSELESKAPEESESTAAVAMISSSELTGSMVAATALVEVLAVALAFLAANALVRVSVL